MSRAQKNYRVALYIHVMEPCAAFPPSNWLAMALFRELLNNALGDLLLAPLGGAGTFNDSIFVGDVTDHREALPVVRSALETFMLMPWATVGYWDPREEIWRIVSAHEDPPASFEVLLSAERLAALQAVALEVMG